MIIKKEPDNTDKEGFKINPEEIFFIPELCETNEVNQSIIVASTEAFNEAPRKFIECRLRDIIIEGILGGKCELSVILKAMDILINLYYK